MRSLQGVKGLKVITRTSSAMYKINVIKKTLCFFVAIIREVKVKFSVEIVKS